MIIDVTKQTRDSLVQLPDKTTGVRYLDGPDRTPRTVMGDRPKLARYLRDAGFQVEWTSSNPARALASRTSPARAATARVNGRKSKGAPKVRALLCPEPLQAALRRLDKGILADLVYLAAGNMEEAIKLLSETRHQRELEVTRGPSTP